jgi:hypothetical protein
VYPYFLGVLLDGRSRKKLQQQRVPQPRLDDPSAAHAAERQIVRSGNIRRPGNENWPGRFLCGPLFLRREAMRILLLSAASRKEMLFW